MTDSHLSKQNETCRLVDGVIYCQCGKPSSHYGTMGVRGAREVREQSEPPLTDQASGHSRVAPLPVEASISSNQNTQDLCVIPDCPNARLELSDFCEQHFRAFGEQETSHTETKAVPLKVYEGAVHGRKEFRRSYRGALELLRKFVAAWEGHPGHENMDRLCEIARNFDGSSQETQHDLPVSLRDPVKNIERGRELLQKWGSTPVTDAALSGDSSAPVFSYQAAPKAGDLCNHCGNVWKVMPGGIIGHECNGLQSADNTND